MYVEDEQHHDHDMDMDTDAPCDDCQQLDDYYEQTRYDHKSHEYLNRLDASLDVDQRILFIKAFVYPDRDIIGRCKLEVTYSATLVLRKTQRVVWREE
jgi:hypothetical protein